MDISLRRATLDDLETVAKIEKGADSKFYHGITDKEELMNFIETCSVFLIEKDEKVIGLVSFEIKEGAAHCNGLVICPELRRNGYGSKAITLAMEQLDNCTKFDLVVHPYNSPAIALYLSLGFIIKEWKDNYFGDGEPRIVMVLENMF